MRDSDVLENNPLISRSALAALHEQVFVWALSRCNYDHTVAEDIVQQAYVELLAGRARFQERSSLKTFVFAVVQNLSKNRYRRKASRLKLLDRFKKDGDSEFTATQVSDERPEVWSAVQQLPQRQRDIIELVFCRDMTIEAAAQVMGVTTGTGRVHYDRAKKALHGKLRHAMDEFDD